MDERTNERLTKLAFALLLAPAFVGLIVAAVVATGRGDWHYGVMLFSIVPAMALALLLGKWLKARNLLQFDGMEGEEKRRAQNVSVFLQAFPLVITFSFIGLTKEMNAVDVMAHAGRLFVFHLLLLVAGILIADRVTRWWDARGK